jgi:NAD(P)-dependent dehydrogenase (short-subunit alcohol dehydrogenase family)
MKTYVITGGTSGIGEALVNCFSKDNIVFCGYRNEKKLPDELPENIIPFYVDYAKPETIQGAVEFIKSKADKIDTLVNVAGCVVAGAIENIPVSELRRQFDVNVFGAVELSQGLLDNLNNGKIINISSMASYGVFPFVAPYCASKRALDILFNSFQIEYGNDISIVSVKPGVIKTPLWEKSIQANKDLLDTEKYMAEANMLIKNAQKNAEKGLDPQKVIDLILKIDDMENPNPSYTIGFDAKCAEILSHLPQSWINKLVSIGLSLKKKMYK